MLGGEASFAQTLVANKRTRRIDRREPVIGRALEGKRDEQIEQAQFSSFPAANANHSDAERFSIAANRNEAAAAVKTE